MSSTIKCVDCGSTNVTLGSVPGLAVCPHCGMVMPIPEDYTPPAVPDPQKVELDPTGVVEIPDEIGVETGWRAWIVKTDWEQRGFPLLQSATQLDYWTPRQVMVAECRFGGKPDTMPHEGHKCGLFCAKNLEHLLKLHYHNYDEANGAWVVIGQVKLWGGVIEGSQGWRSTKGYPEELYVPYEAAKDLAEPLEETYGVEVGTKNWLGTTIG